jgi:hypothetical protein
LTFGVVMVVVVALVAPGELHATAMAASTRPIAGTTNLGGRRRGALAFTLPELKPDAFMDISLHR